MAAAAPSKRFVAPLSYKTKNVYTKLPRGMYYLRIRGKKKETHSESYNTNTENDNNNRDIIHQEFKNFSRKRLKTNKDEIEDGVYTWVMIQNGEEYTIFMQKTISFQEIGSLHLYILELINKDISDLIGSGELKKTGKKIIFNTLSGAFLDKTKKEITNAFKKNEGIDRLVKSHPKYAIFEQKSNELLKNRETSVKQIFTEILRKSGYTVENTSNVLINSNLMTSCNDIEELRKWFKILKEHQEKQKNNTQKEKKVSAVVKAAAAAAAAVNPKSKTIKHKKNPKK